jgi:hypothetical protein
VHKYRQNHQAPVVLMCGFVVKGRILDLSAGFLDDDQPIHRSPVITLDFRFPKVPSSEQSSGRSTNLPVEALRVKGFADSDPDHLSLHSLGM